MKIRVTAKYWPSLGSFLQVRLLLCVLLLLFGCSSTSVWAEGMPKHYTTDGFRNYPLIPTTSSKGVSFYVRRIWVSFFLPKVPSGHYLSEKEAIAQLNELREKDTITWLGQSAFLLRINGKVILTDPFLTESDYQQLDDIIPFKNKTGNNCCSCFGGGSRIHFLKK